MADDADIRIGLDASGVEPALNRLNQAFTTFGKSLALTDKEMANAGKSFDNLQGKMVAKSSALVNASKQSETAARNEAKALEIRNKAYAESLKAQGVRETASGRVASVDTGKLVSGGTDIRARAAKEAAAAEGEYREALAVSDRAAAIAATRNQKWRSDEATAGRKAFMLNQDLLKQQTSSAQMAEVNRNKSWWPPPLLKQTEKVAETFANMNNSVRYALYDVAGTAAVAGTAMLGFAGLAVMAAVAHERAFAEVERTTQTSSRGYEILRQDIQDMAMELPIAFDELTKIASAAGQLGIQASGVANFTKTVGMLTATTNLTSEAAGNALARFKAFFPVVEGGTPGLAVTEATFGNLASSILKVGINSIATESEIVGIGTQISSMGTYAGFSADQVVGLSGALASVKVAPELARGLVTRMFTTLGSAVSSGGVDLEKFAQLAGVSSTEFKNAWGTEAFAPIFTSMIRGLGEIGANGGDAAATLKELGVRGDRDRPVWLRLAGAAGESGEAFTLLTQTMDDARSGWIDNTELSIQYNKIAGTTAARLQVMAQTFEQLFATMGKSSADGLGDIVGFITDIARGFEAVASSDIGQFISTGIIGFAAVAGAGLLVISTIAGTVASIQAMGSAMSAMTEAGIGGIGRLTGAMKIMGAVLSGVTLIGALVAIVGTIGALTYEALQVKSPISDMGSLLGAMKDAGERGAQGIRFTSDAAGDMSEEAKNTRAQAGSMGEALGQIKKQGEDAAAGLTAAERAASGVAYVFDEAALSIFKTQLAASEPFQFAFDTDADRRASDFLNLDFDKIIKESVREGGSAVDEIKKQVDARIREVSPFSSLGDLVNNAGTKEGKAAADEIGVSLQELTGFYNQVGTAIGSSSGKIKEAISANSALASASTASVNSQISGLEALDETTQKTVDNMTAGLTKFADTGKLIDLTQQRIESYADEEGAKKFEESWADAYGGIKFSMEEYLITFRRAGEEQKTFVEGLQQLGARNVGADIIEDLSAMGPEASKLVQSLVSATDAELVEFENLWGQTGYDSQVKFAAQAAIGQHIVNNIMRTGGLDALREFNNGLVQGYSVDELLSKAQRDLDGNPLDVSATPKLTGAEAAKENFRRTIASWSTTVTIYPVVKADNSGINRFRAGLGLPGLATGGYTGDGAKMQPAGIVHKGEFVVTKDATRRIGVGNLYSMMNNTRASRPSRGYANGGLVGGGGTQGGSNSPYVELGPMSLQYLGQALSVRLGIDGRDIAVASSNGDRKLAFQGSN